MTLDEAIIHAREFAKRNKRIIDFEPEDNIDKNIKINCINCAEQHEQLADWLEDYKHIKQWKDDIVNGFCKYDANSFEELVNTVRRKTINDFTERLKDSLTSNYKHFLSIDSDGFAWLTTDAVETHIDHVTGQLKTGITYDR